MSRPTSDTSDHPRHVIQGKSAAQSSWQYKIGALSFHNVRHLLLADSLKFIRCHVGAGQNTLSLHKVRCAGQSRAITPFFTPSLE